MGVRRLSAAIRNFHRLGGTACTVRSAGSRTPDRSSDVATKRTPWTHDASSAARLCSAKLVSSASPSLRLSAEKKFVVRAPADTASAAAACGSVAPADTASAAAACGSEAPAETASAAAAGGSVAPEAPAMLKAVVAGFLWLVAQVWSEAAFGISTCWWHN